MSNDTAQPETQVVAAIKELHGATDALLQTVGDLKQRLQPVLPEMVTNKVDKSDKLEPAALVPLAADLHQVKRNIRTATGTVRDIVDMCQL